MILSQNLNQAILVPNLLCNATDHWKKEFLSHKMTNKSVMPARSPFIHHVFWKFNKDATLNTLGSKKPSDCELRSGDFATTFA